MLWVICKHRRCKSCVLVFIVWLKSFDFDSNSSQRRNNCWRFRCGERRGVRFPCESCGVRRFKSLRRFWLLLSLSYKTNFRCIWKSISNIQLNDLVMYSFVLNNVEFDFQDEQFSIFSKKKNFNQYKRIIDTITCSCSLLRRSALSRRVLNSYDSLYCTPAPGE